MIEMYYVQAADEEISESLWMMGERSEGEVSQEEGDGE